MVDLFDSHREGDGHDPRYDKKESKVKNRKALQLCAQIKETLGLVLAESADPLLLGLTVKTVEPYPTAAQVLVTVGTGEDANLVSESLLRAHGWLRTEVAAEVSRRKIPQLIFRIDNNDP